jgi:hypothetical protein
MFCTLEVDFGDIDGAGSSFLCFCAPRPIFGSTEGVRSSFHVLRSRTHFRRYRVRRMLLSCLLNTFSAVPGASGPVFMFCALGPVFGGTEGVGFSFHVLLSETHFWRYRKHRVIFSCFALLDPFSTAPRAPSAIFMFYTLGPVVVGTEGAQSNFHVLRFRT